MNNTTKNVETMANPFLGYMYKAIPLAFDESLSYYETLCRLKQIVGESITTINNNAEATKELQKLYNELETYVDNYFNNLNVQKEINTKLDTMTKDGTLSNILNNELLTNINNKLNLVFDKKIIIIGDSYAGGATPDEDPSVTSWERLLRQRLGFTLNIDAWSNNQGGTGFTTSTTWLQLLQNINTQGHDNEITDIIICGGYNDRNATEQAINTNINNFKIYANNTYPNAKIHIGFIGNTTNTNEKFKIGTMARIYNNTCKSLNIHYLNNVEYVLHDYYRMFTSDGIHPNQTGQNALADNIIEAWLYGSTHVIYGNQAINSSYGLIQTMLDNNIVRISCTSSFPPRVEANNVVCSGGNAIELTTIEYGHIIGNPNSICSFSITGYAALGGGKYKLIPGTITIEGNKMKFYPILLNDNENGYYQLTTNQLTFPKFSAVFDSIYN